MTAGRMTILRWKKAKYWLKDLKHDHYSKFHQKDSRLARVKKIHRKVELKLKDSRTEDLKRPSHGKLKLANSCWQTRVGVCERRKHSRHTSSICRQQFANVFVDCFCAVHTHQLEFANFSLPCEGRLRTRQLTTQVFNEARAKDYLSSRFGLESWEYSNFVCNACGKHCHAWIRLLSRSGSWAKQDWSWRTKVLLLSFDWDRRLHTTVYLLLKSDTSLRNTSAHSWETLTTLQLDS